VSDCQTRMRQQHSALAQILERPHKSAIVVQVVQQNHSESGWRAAHPRDASAGALQQDGCSALNSGPSCRRAEKRRTERLLRPDRDQRDSSKKETAADPRAAEQSARALQAQPAARADGRQVK